MKIIDLSNPFPNGFGDEQLEAAEKHLEIMKEVYAAIGTGTAYLRYLDGDRKGSVARLSWDATRSVHDEPKIVRKYTRWDEKTNKEFIHQYFSVVAKWDKRSNKVREFLPLRNTEILLEYDGPTVWEKFDSKTAKSKLLENPNQKDINGKVLAVGDEVLYINARYGSRMVLEHGTVIAFDAAVNSSGHTITTLIQSKNPSGESSSLQYPESMVYKK